MRVLSESFESGQWTHRCYRFTEGKSAEQLELGNIFAPDGWAFWFFSKPGELDQPEARYCWVSADPRRVHSGSGAFMWFWFYRKGIAGLWKVLDITPGQIVKVSAWAHAWSNGYAGGPANDDPFWSEWAGRKVVAIAEQDIPALNGDAQNDAAGNILFDVGIDPTGGTDPRSDKIVWSTAYAIYNGYCQQLVTEATAQSNKVTVFLRSRVKWPFKHNDCYWDDVVVEAETPPPSPSPRGAPRIDYVRTYHVIPQDASLERATEIFRKCWQESRATVGGSYDDAGIGDLSVRNAVLWDIPAERRQEFLDWYRKHYPGVNVRFEGAGSVEPKPATDEVLLSQCDPLWASRRFGGPDCTLTIGQAGCFITCLAMAQRYLKIKLDATPITVDETLGPSGYTGCRALWSAINARLGIFISSGTEQDVRNALTTGKCALAEVAPQTYEHFVMVTRYENGRYWMYDPWKNIAGWLDEHYPGVDSWRILAPNPSTAPSGGQLRRLLTAHAQTWIGGLSDFLYTHRPVGFKRVTGCEDIITAQVLNPGMVCVYRPEGNWATPQERVRANLDTLRRVCDELEKRNLPLVFGKRFWMEGPNEVYGTDRADNLRWRDWELQFVRELAAAEPRVGACVFCAAVGNPPEDQWKDLAPLAQVVQENGGLFGYHGYFAANPTWCSLDDFETHGRWLEFRWMQIDDALRSYGATVRWFLGECGAVGGKPVTGGYNLLPNDGWRSKECLNGDWAKYLQYLERFLERCIAWNTTHEDRLVGAALFTVGEAFVGWDSFKLWGNELQQIGEMMKSK